MGHDEHDELWDGVPHMSPQPLTAHNLLVTDLVLALAGIARRRGLRVIGDNQAVFDPADPGDPDEQPQPKVRDWRVPDVTVVDARHLSRRGTEGNATLVVEMRSEHDESRDKFPFYARTGCREIWLVSVERVIEVHSLVDGGYVVIACDANGRIRAPSLGVIVETVDTTDGPRLRITDGADATDI